MSGRVVRNCKSVQQYPKMKRRSFCDSRVQGWGADVAWFEVSWPWGVSWGTVLNSAVGVVSVKLDLRCCTVVMRCVVLCRVVPSRRPINKTATQYPQKWSFSGGPVSRHVKTAGKLE